ARELDIDRETVARHLRHASAPPKPANAPIGSSAVDDSSKPANAPIGSTSAVSSAAARPALEAHQAAGRLSDCEPWRTTIQAKLDLGLSAQRIHQDLASEHGFAGSYYSVR